VDDYLEYLRKAGAWLGHPAVTAGFGVAGGWLLSAAFGGDHRALKQLRSARDRERAEGDAAALRLQRELKELGTKTEEQREVFQFLPELVRQIFTASGPRTVGPLALDLVEQLLAPAQSAFIVARASERKLVLSAGRNLPATLQPGAEADWGQGRLGQVAQTLVTTDEAGFRGGLGTRSGGVSGGVRGVEASGLAGLRAEVVAPLVDGTRLLGLIAIGAPRRRRGQEKRLLAMASDLAAAALVNADRVRTSERWEQCDGLTGVLTRAHLLERLEEAMDHSRQQDLPLSVLLLDIDEFRHYNQSHGHEKGDEVLRQLGPLLRGAVREEDLVARWGGEEFVVVYRGADKQTAVGLANGLRETVAAHRFPDGVYQPGGKLTVSGAVSSFPADSRKAENLVLCAEAGVTEAKSKGRNCILPARPDFLA
jgi:diguanylate cyclase (GGDEF)-like protein